MTVKVILLKSGEDVISDAQEILDKDQTGIIAYHLSNPYVMQLTTTTEETVEVEGDNPAPTTKFQVAYTHWAPLSKQRQFIIPSDWVVTIYDPHDNILRDYCAKHEIKIEEETDGDQTDPAS
jgi:hypothetical protein